MKVLKILNLKKVFSKIILFCKLKKFKKAGKNISFSYGFDFKGENRIELYNNIYGGKNFRLYAWEKYGKQTFNPEVIIKSGASIGNDVFISCINKIYIGKNCLMGDNILISDNSHGSNDIIEKNIPHKDRMLTSKGGIVIGDNVWICRNVCILSNVTIGNNVIIGANSVVTHSFGDNLVIAGSPAKVIKRLEENEL